MEEYLDEIDALLAARNIPEATEEERLDMARKDIERVHPQMKFGFGNPYIGSDSDILHATGFIGNTGHMFYAEHNGWYSRLAVFAPDGTTVVANVQFKFGTRPEEGWDWGSVVLMFDLLIKALPAEFRFEGDAYNGPFKTVAD